MGSNPIATRREEPILPTLLFLPASLGAIVLYSYLTAMLHLNSKLALDRSS
uniref:Uncharacterized protein n=2 Tax=Thermus TaxID=270 RepID=G9MBA5_THET8|nr:hypothetical protein [Thermus sp. 4C]BAL42567.1 hypothetical protein [Thermus thermophilus HB8]